MILYPAIDLSEGSCVRLTRGEFSAKKIYENDPMAVARRFESEGASWLHMVDLDGARDGQMAQTSKLLEVANGSKLQAQVGGGIRSAEQIETLLSGGIRRVVVGSLAVTQSALVRRWLSSFGAERLVLAFDVHLREGVPFPATRGWQDRGDRPLAEVLAEYSGSELRHVLCTDIGRDGVLAGPNTKLYERLGEQFPRLSLIASGGVSSLEDLESLKDAHLAGAIVGKALYEGKISLAEAIQC